MSEALKRLQDYLKTIPTDALEAIVTQLDEKGRDARTEEERISLVHASVELTRRYRDSLKEWETAEVVEGFRQLAEQEYAKLPKIVSNLFWELEAELQRRFPGLEEATDDYVDGLTREEIDENDGKFCRFVLDYVKEKMDA